jgi:3-deoxy-D-manno-octulosonic acid kinase
MAFVMCEEGPYRAWVRAEWQATLTAALWHGAGCAPDARGGRVQLMRFTYPGGTGLIRPYRRGGFIRHFLSSWYFADNRPKQELALLVRAQAAGLPVPEPLGAGWRWRGPWLSGALATKELPGDDLLHILQNEAQVPRNLLLRVGRLFHRMHEAGLLHADLQVKNVLISGGMPYLLDLDRARWRQRVSPRQRARNLARFQRSLRKHGLEQAFEPVREGYERQASEGTP